MSNLPEPLSAKVTLYTLLKDDKELARLFNSSKKADRIVAIKKNQG
jgi:hypothetical protein